MNDICRLIPVVVSPSFFLLLSFFAVFLLRFGLILTCFLHHSCPPALLSRFRSVVLSFFLPLICFSVVNEGSSSIPSWLQSVSPLLLHIPHCDSSLTCLRSFLFLSFCRTSLPFLHGLTHLLLFCFIFLLVGIPTSSQKWFRKRSKGRRRSSFRSKDIAMASVIEIKKEKQQQ